MTLSLIFKRLKQWFSILVSGTPLPCLFEMFLSSSAPDPHERVVI